MAKRLVTEQSNAMWEGRERDVLSPKEALLVATVEVQWDKARLDVETAVLAGDLSAVATDDELERYVDFSCLPAYRDDLGGVALHLFLQEVVIYDLWDTVRQIRREG